MKLTKAQRAALAAIGRIGGSRTGPSKARTHTSAALKGYWLRVKSGKIKRKGYALKVALGIYSVFCGLTIAIAAQFAADRCFAPPVPPPDVPLSPFELHQKAFKLSRWAAYASMRAGLYELQARNAERGAGMLAEK